ncbi:hypothetical protein Nepgr_023575 [Nepenthes gracilis]|uniref:Uncharacterized protein n=1 Tax=Nepenthes gracilis TaxID=150966 RepID=A0AAD3XXZ7_NEPGR|nr:hypothetical protein Nepgr_023575 [Nepenthes gracilis]
MIIHRDPSSTNREGRRVTTKARRREPRAGFGEQRERADEGGSGEQTALLKGISKSGVVQTEGAKNEEDKGRVGGVPDWGCSA